MQPSPVLVPRHTVLDLHHRSYDVVQYVSTKQNTFKVPQLKLSGKLVYVDTSSIDYVPAV
jgi:hypothetical protein